MSKPGSRVVTVDEHDNPIGLKNYEDMRYQDIYRVTALWLSDKASNAVLMAQRRWTKRNDPGKWACAVSGTIEEGDTYEDNIVQEAEEELGLTGLMFTPGPKQFVDNGVHKYFCQWFYATVDKNKAKIAPQEEEVEAIRWISVHDLVADVQAQPETYTPATMEALQTLGVAPSAKKTDKDQPPRPFSTETLEKLQQVIETKPEGQHQLASHLTKAAKQVMVGARYRHYKGAEYTVTDLALREQDSEPCVIYRAEYGKHIAWIRPLSSWLESVDVNGKRMKRFERVN